MTEWLQLQQPAAASFEQIGSSELTAASFRVSQSVAFIPFGQTPSLPKYPDLPTSTP